MPPSLFKSGFKNLLVQFLSKINSEMVIVLVLLPIVVNEKKHKNV